MYSTLPIRQRRNVLLALSTFWILSSAAGTSAILYEPNRLTEAMGPVTTAAWGAVLAAAGLAAAVGVALRHYRVEWVASWFSAAASSPYILAIWWLVAEGELNRLTQAFFMSAILVAFLKRAASCSAHAAKMRVLHEEVKYLGDLDLSSGSGHG